MTIRVNGTVLRGVGPVQLKQQHQDALQNSAGGLASPAGYQPTILDDVSPRGQSASSGYETINNSESESVDVDVRKATYIISIARINSSSFVSIVQGPMVMFSELKWDDNIAIRT